MPIEGPLRELGIHDVFQLLDLSRKTGMLRVTSELRDDEGVVYFARGRVVSANIRSRPVTPQSTPITDRERQRKARQQIESTVFELISWREGFFSFEERDLTDLPTQSGVQVATESLLMEGARRIDEWSRIADKVPNLGMVPVLAAVEDGHESQLDLLPHEWEVLTMIDGKRDLRAIAAALGRSEFDVAKIAYGLVTTGVVQLRVPPRPSQETQTQAAERAEAASHLHLGFTALRSGNLQAARSSFEQFLALAPDDAEAPKARSALEAVHRLLNVMAGPNG